MMDAKRPPVADLVPPAFLSWEGCPLAGLSASPNTIPDWADCAGYSDLRVCVYRCGVRGAFGFAEYPLKWGVY